MQIQGKLNTLRSLSSEHGIVIGFFSRVRNHVNPHIEPAFPKFILQRFFKKNLIIGHDATSISVEIVQFAPRCLGATVFRNEMVKMEMTHIKLGSIV